MGKLYQKSQSSEFCNYFSQVQDLDKDYRVFSLRQGNVIPESGNKLRPWEQGVCGVPLSRTKSGNAVLVDHTDAHTLVVGPTGSKKSRLVVMPVTRILGCEAALESMVIADPKAEIYDRTGDYLHSHGYQTYLLNLREPNYGIGWNPLHLPYLFYQNGEIDRAYEFINDIAENLIHTSESTNDPFWDNSAGSFFFGIALLLFRYCSEYKLDSHMVNLNNIVFLRVKLFSGSTGKNSDLWKYICEDPITESALSGTYNAPNDTRASILSVFDQKMRLFYIQPSLTRMLADHQLDLQELFSKPTAIFMILPDEKTGYHGLASLFIKQSYEYAVFTAQSIRGDGSNSPGRLKNRLNYILDEFSSLPTIRDFPAMITAARSRNIRFTLVIQSKKQLVQRYREEADTIITNCNNWIFLSSRELDFLKEISELCGVVGNPQKPLLPVNMLQRLNKDEGEALVIIGRNKPHIGFLPDISDYDGDGYQHCDMKKVMHPDTPLLTSDSIDKLKKKYSQRFEDFMRSAQDDKSSQKKPVQANTPDIDELIHKIDLKIAELEKEEQQKAAKAGTLKGGSKSNEHDNA